MLRVNTAAVSPRTLLALICLLHLLVHPALHSGVGLAPSENHLAAPAAGNPADARLEGTGVCGLCRTGASVVEAPAAAEPVAFRPSAELILTPPDSYSSPFDRLHVSLRAPPAA